MALKYRVVNGNYQERVETFNDIVDTKLLLFPILRDDVRQIRICRSDELTDSALEKAGEDLLKYLLVSAPDTVKGIVWRGLVRHYGIPSNGGPGQQ